MINLAKIGVTNLAEFPCWPPVHPYSEHDAALIISLLKTSSHDIREYLFELRSDYQHHANAVILPLSVIYAHFYGYIDSPFVKGIDDFDSEIVRVKRILETEMIDHIIKPDLSEIDNFTHSPAAAVDYLKHLTITNPGVNHKFFDYVMNEIPVENMKKFLWFETIRNEVVDDEVAMLVPGTQHAMKQVVTSNLWDECGNGKIDGFHTSWLIRLLSHKNQWNEFMEFRKSRPWFSMLTSHSFNSLLTSPSRNFAAYGTFLINESWVVKHFVKILAGMDRLKINDEDRRIYFEAHCNIDDHHSAELIEGIRQQMPALKQHELREVLVGAHQAVASATVMYENMLQFFQGKTHESL